MIKNLFIGNDNWGVTFDYYMFENDIGLEICVNGNNSYFINDEEIKQLIEFLQNLPIKP